jgi:hypothetical protein
VNRPSLAIRMTALRVILGATTLGQSVLALASHPEVAATPHGTIIRWLALIEAAGAALLLVPPTRLWGGRVLLGVFVAAVGLHALHLEAAAAATMLVYLAVTWVLLAEPS